MNAGTINRRDQVDNLDLPLNALTSAIEDAGRIIEELRAQRASRALPPPHVGGTDLLSLARSIYRFRGLRDQAFGPKLFSDPAWDILLDLFIACEEGTKVSISSACISSSVPATTALRHLSALAKEGLVRRVTSDEDGRVASVALTPAGYDKLAAVLRSWSG